MCAGAHTHTHTHTHMHLLPIWTPDLFQPSDSHWHLPLELSSLTCWSWWEWMMLLLEEEKRKEKKEKRGWRWWWGGQWLKRREKRGKDWGRTVNPPSYLSCPRNPSGPPARRKGHGATQPYILITKEPSLRPATAGLQYGLTALSLHLSVTFTVYSHHQRDVQ